MVNLQDQLILNEFEVCPFSGHCQYNRDNTCFGARSDRKNKFTCEYVKNGRIVDGGINRLAEDRTGKMKVLME